MIDRLVAFIGSLNTGHWIAIVGIVVGTFIGSFTIANYFAGRRERKLKAYETTPAVKATINKASYEDGWRSVQLHIVAPSEEQNFHVNNWNIDRVRLVRPWRDAILARAENDDYATGKFYPDHPVRVLMGKAEGRPQRFALEFFIKFKGKDDSGKKAKFEVTFSHINGRRQNTAKVWSAVPASAQ